MTVSSKIKLWVGITVFFSFLLGVAALVWADFGMPGWFFVFTQVWFWTLGLPTMVGVLSVTALWGIQGWTTLPLWLYSLCVVIIATVCQFGCFFVAYRLWQRLPRRHP